MVDHAVLTGPGSRRGGPRLFVQGSVAVVAVGLITQVVLAGGGRPDPVPLEPAKAFAVLADAQEPRDVVGDEELKYAVRPETTRYLGDGPQGSRYLGVSLIGEACLITTDAEGAADVGCSTFPAVTASVVLEDQDSDGEDVALVADGYRPIDGWHAVGPNLVVQDA